MSSFVKFRSTSYWRGQVENFRPIRDKGGHLWFWIGPKNTSLLVEDIEYLLPGKIGQIPFWWEVEYVLAILIQTERPSLFSNQPEKKHTLGRGCWVHAIEDDVPNRAKKNMCVYGPPTY